MFFDYGHAKKMFLVDKKARENKIASYFLWFGYFC